MVEVKRGEATAMEACEVMACQAAGESGYWRIMVATHDGTLLSVDYNKLRLIDDSDGAGPYR